MADTLTYPCKAAFSEILIDLALLYDRIRRASATTSVYYWAIAGVRHTFSAKTISTCLQFCLTRLAIKPPPKVSWTSHSLRIAAASESVAIHVQEYRILI